MFLANNLTHSAPRMPKLGFECNTMQGEFDLGMIFDNILHSAKGMDEASKSAIGACQGNVLMVEM